MTQPIMSVKIFTTYRENYKEAEKKILAPGSFVATPLLENGILYADGTHVNFYVIQTGK